MTRFLSFFFFCIHSFMTMQRALVVSIIISVYFSIWLSIVLQHIYVLIYSFSKCWLTARGTPFIPRALLCLYQLLLIRGRRYFCIYSICWWLLLNVYSWENSSSQTSDEAVPVPVVQIDQDSDRDATIVQLSFGDRLGALLDTVYILHAPLMLSLHCCCSKLWYLHFLPYLPIILPGIHCLQMKALKDLGLDVTKGSVTTDSAVTQTKFHIMRLWVLAPSCFIFACSI